jgi:fido (protein-threonine AMPylation protein)
MNEEPFLIPDDPYLIPGTYTLKNTLGITDRDRLFSVEVQLFTARQDQLRLNPIKGEYDYTHLQAIHKHLFQDIYEWAGQPRTIGIQKVEPILEGASVMYPHPDDRLDSLSQRAEMVFRELAKDNHLKGIKDPDQYAEKLAHHMAEIWEAHPFREGNTRATLSFINQLSHDAGYPLPDRIAKNPVEFRNALVLYSQDRREPLQEIMKEAVARGQRTSIGDAAVEQTYQDLFSVYTVKKLEQAERIEDKLELLLDRQMASYKRNRNNSPGLLASSKTRGAWQASLARQQRKLNTIKQRLRTVHDIREGMGLHGPKLEELAIGKLRKNHPKVAADWDSMRKTARQNYEAKVLAKKKSRSNKIARSRSIKTKR